MMMMMMMKTTTSCRTETQTVSRTKKAVAAISQWCRRLSACVKAHGEHFEHILWCFRGSVRKRPLSNVNCIIRSRLA